MNKLIEFISQWQIENDSEFLPLPVDEHSSIIFNFKNHIHKFIFSNESKRNACKDAIPIELLSQFSYFSETDEGLTYYVLS